jgi:hypothetical protein
MQRGRLRRRGLLAAAATTACAAAGLAGCARLSALVRAAGMRPRLQVLAVGFAQQGGLAIRRALEGAAQAWVGSGRGFATVQVEVTAAPPLSWYRCATGGSCLPATALGARTSFFSGFSGGTGATVLTDRGDILAVRGRTALGLPFGDPPGSVEPAPVLAPAPDLVVASDVWQYWLAPLARDVEELWRSHPEDRGGIPDAVAGHGRFYAGPDVGTIFAGLPLLRSPLVLVQWTSFGAGPSSAGRQGPDALAGASGPAAGWTWQAFAETVSSLRDGLSTEGFLLDSAASGDVAASALAAAIVAAHGGQIARVPPAGAPVLSFAQGPAAAALELRATIYEGPRAAPAGPGDSAVAPQWLVDPLVAFFRQTALPTIGRPIAGSHLRVAPLPGGPVRRAVPATYLCAWLPQAARQQALAEDFASYLLTPKAQTILAQSGAGLALRPADAAQQLSQPPWSLGVEWRQPAALGDPVPDLLARDLYGGEETDANAGGYQRAADAFVDALRQLQTPLVRPSAVRGVLGAVQAQWQARLSPPHP